MHLHLLPTLIISFLLRKVMYNRGTNLFIYLWIVYHKTI